MNGQQQSNLTEHGVWLYSEQQADTDLTGFSGIGASSFADLILTLVIFAVANVLAYVWQKISRRDCLSQGLKDYHGLVYCDIDGQDVRFFKSVRGTSRFILRPAAIARPLSTLTKFQTYLSDRPKIVFAFSDGFELELYSRTEPEKLTEFRKAVSLRME